MIDYVYMSMKRWMKNGFMLNNILSFIKLETLRPSTKRIKRVFRRET